MNIGLRNRIGFGSTYILRRPKTEFDTVRPNINDLGLGSSLYSAIPMEIGYRTGKSTDELQRNHIFFEEYCPEEAALTVIVPDEYDEDTEEVLQEFKEARDLEEPEKVETVPFLQQHRGSIDFDERLLEYYGLLD